MLKQVAGWLGSVLGAVGMALCLAVILGAWSLSGSVTTQLLGLFPPIETALSFGDETATQFGTFVGDKQAQFYGTSADLSDSGMMRLPRDPRAGGEFQKISGLTARACDRGTGSTHWRRDLSAPHA